jgi:hypothetical protein
MPAWTFAGSTWTTAAGDKTVTATPAIGDLIVIIAASSGLSGGTTAVTDNNSSGTYTQADSDRTGFSTTGVLTVWVRTALIPAASSTIFTAAQAGSTGGGLHVYRLSGMTLTGASAVRSNGGESSGVAGTTPAPVLNQTPHDRNPMLIAVAAGANAAVMNPRTGYIEGADGGYNTPATGLGSAVLDSGENAATLTFGGTTSTAFASVGVELESQERSYHGLGFASTAVFMGGLRKARESWHRRKSGIFVPDLWVPERAVI